MKTVSLHFCLNGNKVTTECLPMERLLDVVRNQCGNTGTKEGCGEGECGACSVLLDGVLVNSCLVPALQAQNKNVLTVEGLAGNKELSALQRSFFEHGGAQCGICTPGMLIAAESLLRKNKNPSEDDMRQALAGNLCRCTGYTRIFVAIEKAAQHLREGSCAPT